MRCVLTRIGNLKKATQMLFKRKICCCSKVRESEKEKMPSWFITHDKFVPLYGGKNERKKLFHPHFFSLRCCHRSMTLNVPNKILLATRLISCVLKQQNEIKKKKLFDVANGFEFQWIIIINNNDKMGKVASTCECIGAIVENIDRNSFSITVNQMNLTDAIK